MKAYKIKNCRVAKDKTWSGVVLVRDGESVPDAIKERFGIAKGESLYCEKLNDENFGYVAKRVPLGSVKMSSLETISDILKLAEIERGDVTCQ